MFHRRPLYPWVLVLAVTGLLFCLDPSDARGQANEIKYWIFFTDKGEIDRNRAAKIARSYVTPNARRRRHQRGAKQRPADDLPLADDYLEGLRRLGAEPVVQSRWFNAVSARLSEQQLEQVERLSFVQKTRPVGRRIGSNRRSAGHDMFDPAPHPALPPATQLDYGNSLLQLRMINAISPLEQQFVGEGITFGFLDAPFDFTHPALRHIQSDGRLLGTRDFTGPLEDSTGIENESLHGMAVASVAVGHAPGQLIGPGYGSSVLAATTEYVPTERNQEEDFFVAGLEWLERQGVDLVNVSLGYTTFDPGEDSYAYEDMDGNTAMSTRAADRAVSKGVVMVASAGNEGWCSSPSGPCWYHIGAPADGDSVIAVGAVTPDSTRASFSSFGPTYDGQMKPDVSAPGATIFRNGPEGIYVAAPSGNPPYEYSNGTSFASPLVAGVVAQMLQANPMLTPIKVREILRSTASQSDNPDNALGWGIINAGAAVNAVRELTYPDQPTLTAIHPNPFVNQARLTVNMPESEPEPARLVLFDMLGRRVAVPFAGTLFPGPNTITVDGTDLGAGVYLYRLQSRSFSESGTIIRAH